MYIRHSFTVSSYTMRSRLGTPPLTQVSLLFHIGLPLLLS